MKGQKNNGEMKRRLGEEEGQQECGCWTIYVPNWFFFPWSNNSKVEIDIFFCLSVKHITFTEFIELQQLLAVDSNLNFDSVVSKIEYTGQRNRENILSRSIIEYKTIVFSVFFLDFERQYNRKSLSGRFFSSGFFMSQCSVWPWAKNLTL